MRYREWKRKDGSRVCAVKGEAKVLFRDKSLQIDIYFLVHPNGKVVIVTKTHKELPLSRPELWGGWGSWSERRASVMCYVERFLRYISD